MQQTYSPLRSDRSAVEAARKAAGIPQDREEAPVGRWNPPPRKRSRKASRAALVDGAALAVYRGCAADIIADHPIDIDRIAAVRAMPRGTVDERKARNAALGALAGARARAWSVELARDIDARNVHRGELHDGLRATATVYAIRQLGHGRIDPHAADDAIGRLWERLLRGWDAADPAAWVARVMARESVRRERRAEQRHAARVDEAEARTYGDVAAAAEALAAQYATELDTATATLPDGASGAALRKRTKARCILAAAIGDAPIVGAST